MQKMQRMPKLPPTFRPSINKHETQIEQENSAIKSVPPVYLGAARILKWGLTNDGGMYVKFSLKDVGLKEVNPFKGLRYGDRNGQRLKIWIGRYSEIIELSLLDKDADVIFKGEAQLTFWVDHCKDGTTVKINLDPGPDGADGRHPFYGLKGGVEHGDDVIFGSWIIDDDEQIIAKKAAPKTTKLATMKETRQVNTVSRDPEFLAFLLNRKDSILAGLDIKGSVDEDPKEWVNSAVRAILGVESRAVLSSENYDGIQARKKWRELFLTYLSSDEFNERKQKLAFAGI